MCGGRPGLMPVARSTASGNLAGWAVASVIIGAAPTCSSATFTPTALCGHRSSPVVFQWRAMTASVSSSEQRPEAKVARSIWSAPWLMWNPPVFISAISWVTAAPSRP